MGPNHMQLRLPKNISRREEQTAKVVTGHDEVVTITGHIM